jgi:hypothetical protein
MELNLHFFFFFFLFFIYLSLFSYDVIVPPFDSQKIPIISTYDYRYLITIVLRAQIFHSYWLQENT